jgi:hypothetical protein
MATTKKRYYISVNFVCDTDGKEPTDEQLNEAFKAMVTESQKENVFVDFEIWDEEAIDSCGDLDMGTTEKTAERVPVVDSTMYPSGLVKDNT